VPSLLIRQKSAKFSLSPFFVAANAWPSVDGGQQHTASAQKVLLGAESILSNSSSSLFRSRAAPDCCWANTLRLVFDTAEMPIFVKIAQTHRS